MGPGRDTMDHYTVCGRGRDTRPPCDRLRTGLCHAAHAHRQDRAAVGRLLEHRGVQQGPPAAEPGPARQLHQRLRQHGDGGGR